VNLLKLREGEKISAVVPVREFSDDHYLVLATRQGTIKKTPLSAYGNPRRVGIVAITMDEGDRLIGAKVTDGSQQLVLAKANGKAIRFPEADVRPMGRSARGVRGVTVDPDDEVIGMVTLERSGSIIVVTEKGYGKRTTIDEYRITRRGGKGIITVKASARNGRLVGIREVVDSDELMIITRNGIILRLAVSGVSMLGRNTQGVKMMNLDEGDAVMAVAPVVREEENGGEGEGGRSGSEGEGEG
jgi:DNA gyrase subunit A